MSGHICPGCGTERGAAPEGGRPGCDCAARAVEAARAERAAETAAAEDFDPLRIRPYVTLPDPDEQDGAECGDARFASGTAYSEQVAPDGPGGPGAATPARSTRSTIPVRVPRRADEPPVRGQGRPVLWLSVAGVAATVAAVGTMAFAGGLFSAGPDRERDRALPITVTSAPDPGGEPSAPASASAPAAAAPRAPAASAAP
ncbi:MAG TPA: peptidoglycan-binding protein, partial [Streptomyces sp.]|nr:peptidoglycan-binding protein [Streptomyces sp.]